MPLSTNTKIKTEIYRNKTEDLLSFEKNSVHSPFSQVVAHGDDVLFVISENQELFIQKT